MVRQSRPGGTRGVPRLARRVDGVQDRRVVRRVAAGDELPAAAAGQQDQVVADDRGR